MDPLWLLLLLPLAVASGWYTARREVSKLSKEATFNLPSAYFKGLNFLLNEQPDKAIEVFIKVLEVDSETVEMHLTLGNLFRRRGELERATRIHQNIIARPNLSNSQRLQALFELAQDYFKAGLFDRAESLFLELADVPSHAEQALRYLSQLYEQEKEWENAISATQRLQSYTEKDISPIVAQYYCELAEISLEKRDYDKAREHIDSALEVDPKSTRATIQLGNLDFELGDYARAIETWRKIEEQDPRYLGEVIDKVVIAYRKINDDEGLWEFLSNALDDYGGPKLLKAQIEEIEHRKGRSEAVVFLTDWLHKHPSLHGLRSLVSLKESELNSSTSASDLEPLQALLVSLFDTDGLYRCRQCGFVGRTLHWQCPGCKGWYTQSPMSDEHSMRQVN
ncbi:lipopolysaccharide assembly protein LapB [Gammaproteobacteria bacterium]|nr:lipopolysaccharide assembly protein LapB [Gammaproteobacteria bacterium]